MFFLIPIFSNINFQFLGQLIISGGRKYRTFLLMTLFKILFKTVKATLPVWMIWPAGPPGSGTLPFTHTSFRSGTRTLPLTCRRRTRITFDPFSRLLLSEMNVLAINPCYRIDKLIAYICTPLSHIEEPMRVILQQMDIVFMCKGRKDGDIGRVNEG